MALYCAASDPLMSKVDPGLVLLTPTCANVDEPPKTRRNNGIKSFFMSNLV